MCNTLIKDSYKRKIRLLVTNRCPYSCFFCHNEGQECTDLKELELGLLNKNITLLRKMSDTIVLTGGEPLSYSKLRELVFILIDYGFNVKIDTAYENLSEYVDIFRYLSDLHVSFLGADKNDPHINENGNFLNKFKNLQAIRNALPNLKLTINVPIVSKLRIIEDIDKYISMAKELEARLQFIEIFDEHNKVLLQEWRNRYVDLFATLCNKEYNVAQSFLNSVVFENCNGEEIKIMVVGCCVSGAEFRSMRCMDVSDYTITPDLKLKMCRWQDSSIDLDRINSYVYTNECFELAKTCQANCVHFLPEISNDYKEDELIYTFNKHYTWPWNSVDNEYVHRTLNNNEISYIGKSGTVAYFENKFAEYYSSKYALTTSSGTTALYLAYKALGFSEGAKIILPVYSYPGTITPLVELGADLVFCDVEKETGNIDVNDLRKKINDDIRGIVITHMWGNPVNIDEIMEISKEKSIALVEDCSHAYGATYKGKKVGTFGDISCFSLQANKTVYAGEGGVILTNNAEYAEKIIALSSLKERLKFTVNGELKKYWETGLFSKFKIHPVGASLGIQSLEQLGTVNNSRKRNYLSIVSKLIDFNILENPLINIDERVFYTFKMTLNKNYGKYRDQMLQQLILSRIDAKRPHVRPLYYTQLFSNLDRRNYPNAEKYYKNTLSLPSFTYEEPHIVDYYSKKLLEVLKEYI